MTNLDCVLKSKDITLPTKAHIVKAMVFTVVVYGCAAKSRQSCPTPSDSMDCSTPGSSVHGIFQARVLEWSAIAFSRMDVRAGQ